MIRYDPQGNIGFMILLVFLSRQLADPVQKGLVGIDGKQRVHVLDNHGQTLQSHSRIDILLGQLRIVSVSVVFKLGKDVVPDFDIAVTVAADGAGRLSAAVLLSPVIVNLRTGAAGTGAMLPEVVFLPETEDPLLGDPDLLVPDPEGLVVVQIYGRIQTVRLQTHHLR